MKGLTAREQDVLEGAVPPADDGETAAVHDYAAWRGYIIVCRRLEKRGLLVRRAFTTSDGEEHGFFIRTPLGVLALTLQRAMDAGRMAA